MKSTSPATPIACPDTNNVTPRSLAPDPGCGGADSKPRLCQLDGVRQQLAQALLPAAPEGHRVLPESAGPRDGDGQRGEQREGGACSQI
jgi:hypothetical protein